MLEAVRAEAPEATVVAVASGEVYGPPAALPVDESAPLRPQNPYAVSKASADLLAGLYADAHGLRVIRARPVQPRRARGRSRPTRSPPSPARPPLGGDPVRIVTGNPDTRRDYTDVRDVVRAYRLLAERGEPGVYNVCSGRTASAARARGALAGGRAELDTRSTRRSCARTRSWRSAATRRGCARRPAGSRRSRSRRTLADTVAWWSERL